MATTGSTEERHRMCHTVLQDYHDFPEREDPTTWSCFETLLRALLGLLGTDYNVLPKTTGPIIARPASAAVYVRNVLQDLKSQRSLWSL
ncbi:hypothetical protein M406DRAFT_57260 [Cryphonectria parasitica EP155]|uniref:Uncharacterized protein n=1 Tax=Cryphonectria parasitica (strain ATCC 38755 / EP155) TaxID=660469 RepID=A0A9P5CLC0_CRYP1|nr:uncharacterized protein M406DRAFT_57260 [Cryphonectria parasitica EP155]KAF3763174.1 hypothetical protein M406DRAFT_57260 [Cryphonectria parasitica EP155]